MITDIIVWLSALFTLAFLVVWASSARVRAWIEHPKHRFLDEVRAYDRVNGPRAAWKETSRHERPAAATEV